jgi:hypothetical protein
MKIFYTQSNRDNYMAFGDFTVTRASTKNVLGSAGTYVSVANNVPAFEFNADGSYRGLLVEPGATNLAQRSQEFDDAYWTKTNATITANSTVAPDGATTADTVTTAGGLLGDVRRSFTIANDSVTRAFSVFIKKETVSSFGIITISQTGGTARNTGIQFNKQTGVAQYVGNGFGGGYTAPIAFSVDDAGQFWRMSVSIDNNSTGNTTLVVVMFPNYGTSFGNFTAVNGTSVLWQAQLETGAVATSPIVTTGSTASRVADVVSLASASSVIGQSAGTIYFEFNSRVTGGSVAKRGVYLTDGTNNNRIAIGKTTDDKIEALVTTGGVMQANIATAINQSGVFKCALAYALNDFALYVNGAQVGVDASGTVPATSTFDLGQVVSGGQNFNDHIRSVALFPTRLDNATLATLTTP